MRILVIGKLVIILIKQKYVDEINKTNSDTFELVIKLQHLSKSSNKLFRTFDKTCRIVTFLLDYYTKSCVKENIYPESYPYEAMYTLESMKKRLTGKDVGTIRYQIVNAFNRVSLIMTSQSVLLPISETGIIPDDSIEALSFRGVIADADSRLLTLRQYIKYYKKIGVSILGITQSNKERIGGLLTSFGYFVPYLTSPSDGTHSIPNLNFVYYLDLDEKLIYDKENRNLEYNKFNNLISKTNSDVFALKTLIAKRMETSPQRDQMKEYLRVLIISTNFTRSDKIQRIVNILTQLVKHRTSHIDFLLKCISNEMLMDNVENSLINGIVVNQNNRNEIIKRETESILLNSNDIYNWINTYQQFDM